MSTPHGPALGDLLARLRATPPALVGPEVGRHVDVDVLLADTLDLLDPPADLWAQQPVERMALSAPQAQAVAVACWLASAPGLGAALAGPDARGRVVAGRDTLVALAGIASPAMWLQGDPDREEEVVRAFLRAARVLPAGESADVAEDRWLAVSSAARRQALQDAARAAELARRLAEQRAKEAAARATYV